MMLVKSRRAALSNDDKEKYERIIEQMVRLELKSTNKLLNLVLPALEISKELFETSHRQMPKSAELLSAE